MTRETESRSEKGSRTNLGIGILLALLCLPALSSCQDFRFRDAVPSILSSDATPSIQEGEITLQDGEENYLLFPKPFNAPPRVEVVELRQSQFLKKPFSKNDFLIVRQEWNFFRLRNLHDEHSCGSWATVKWRAEGVLVADQPSPADARPAGVLETSEMRQTRLVEKVRKAGGTVELVPPLPTGCLVGIDLHGASIADDDLQMLSTATCLHSLNLHDARITDAGLKYLGEATGLQTLYLNDTSVSDAGIQHLQGLTDLTVLGLTNTRVTDDGLRSLSGMTKLRELSLGGARITDTGLAHLKGLKNLKLLVLTHTSVTKAGVQELKKALPNTHIVE
jgi:hypothetical protein